MAKIRAVIADDDDDVRMALEEVLESDARFEVVRTAADGEEMLVAVKETDPDVVLLDVRMPGGGPTAACAVAALPHPPVVVAVSASTEVSTVVGMLRAGAVGYLGKGRLGPSLPDLVARCLEGQVILAVETAQPALRALLAGGRPGAG